MNMLSGFTQADRERASRRRNAARDVGEGARELAGRMAELDEARTRLEQARLEAEQARDEYRRKAAETAAGAVRTAMHAARNVLNGGEISPQMAARMDQPRYQTGCELLENMVPLPQGGITKRPGLEHVGETLKQGEGDVVRLIPFVFNVDETRVLELDAAEGSGGIETKPSVPESRLQINANGEAQGGSLCVRCTVLGADAGKCAYFLRRERLSPDWQPIPAENVTRESVSVALVRIGPLGTASEIDGIRIEYDGLSAFFMFSSGAGEGGIAVGANWQLVNGVPCVDCTAAGASVRDMTSVFIHSSLGESRVSKVGGAFSYWTDDLGREHARFVLPNGETLEQMIDVEMHFPDGTGGFTANVYRFFGDEFGNAGDGGGAVADPSQGSALRVWLPTEAGADILLSEVRGALPYGADDLRELSFVQCADVIYFAHRRYPPAKLSRHADDDWRFEVVDWLPDIAAPVITEAVAVGSIPAGENSRTNYSYVATAIDGRTGEESLPSAPVTVENAAPLSQSYYIRLTIAPVAGASEYRIYKKKGGVFGYIGRMDGSSGNWTETRAARAVFMAAALQEEPYFWFTARWSGETVMVTLNGDQSFMNDGAVFEYRTDGGEWQAATARKDTDKANLWHVSGLPEGAIELRVTDGHGVSNTASIEGERVPDGGTEPEPEPAPAEPGVFEDRNIGADTEDTPPAARNPFDAPGKYPSLVFLHQQRLGFAASDAQPLTVWLSQAGNFESMASSLPPADDDAIEATLATEQANRILWCHSDRNVLALGTAGGEWTFSGADGGAPTPSSLSFQPQTFYGANAHLAPLRAGRNLLFVQRGGKALREYGYSFGADRYESGDLSLLARHILRESPVVSWAWQAEPCSVVWCVRADGSLAGLTCMREHDVVGWHRHVSPGARLESVISLPGFRGDTLIWFVTWRNGSRRVERLASFFEGGSPAAAIHVDGRERVAYVGRCVPCMPESTLENGSTLMRVRKLNAVKCRVVNSQPFAARIGDGDLMPVPARGAAYVSRADWAVPLAGGWRDGDKLELVFDGPGPATVLAAVITLELADMAGAQAG